MSLTISAEMNKKKFYSQSFKLMLKGDLFTKLVYPKHSIVQQKLELTKIKNFPVNISISV